VASVTLPGSTVHPTVEITPSGFAYLGTNGVMNNSGVSGTDGAWHDIVVAHQYARGLTWFYVDGVLAATVSERLTPVGFVLGGHGSAVTRPGSPVQADYEDWFVHRSMMNLEEVRAQLQGNLQQASLELYAPLNDGVFVQGGSVANMAQSYSVGSVNGPAADYVSVPSLPPPTGLIVSSNYTPAMILNWADPGTVAEDAYYVDRSTAGGTWTNIAMLSAHAATYTDSAVGIGTNYQYRVSYSLSGLRSDYALSAAVLLPSTNSGSGPVLIDFGPNNVLDGNVTTNPAPGGFYWNNMTATASGSSITNLVTTNNLPSPIAVALTSGSWAENGIRNGGLTNPSAALLGVFAVPTVTEDYFYINQTYGTANGTQTMLISGLNPSLAYNIYMFATRNTAGNVTPLIRTTTYSVTDARGTHSTNLVTSGTAVNSGTNPYDTAGNDKTIATLNGVVPNSSGQLTLSVAVGDTANFAYIGALEIVPVVSPPLFATQPQSQVDRLGTTATLTAVAASSQPANYQWYYLNAPVAGATGTNLVLANLGYTNAGNYYAVATNNLGSATSAVAVLSVVSVHTAAQGLLIDFGPDGVSNTDGARTLSPDVNGNYWNNMTNTANGATITNLVTANNSPTTVGVTLTSATWANNGITHGGLITPDPALLGDFAISTATEDYFYIQTLGTTATLEITGLNPALTYNLSMFATRTTSASDTRTSIYTVTDVNGTHTVSLQTSGPGAGSAANPYGNDQTIVPLNGLVPNASGQLTLTLSIGANTGNFFAYLGALEIAVNGFPPVFIVNPQSQTNLVGTTSTLAALATDSQPINYQWYFMNGLLTGATGTNLVHANVGYANAGSYYLVASNILGIATSSVAVVTIVAPSAFHLPPPGPLAGGWQVQFAAIPGVAYHLLRATNLNGSWIDLGPVVAPANGQCVFVDTNASSAQAFYRAVVP
jgi:hypothetical protein